MGRTVSIDQDHVGSGLGSFFKPEKFPQRIALLPSLIDPKDLVVSPELKAAAEKGEAEAVEKLSELIDLKTSLEDGLKAKPSPRVLKYKDGDVEKYMWPRAESAASHYLEQERMSFLCKKTQFEAQGLEAYCCTKSGREPAINYAVVLIVYDTDKDGNPIILDEAHQKPIDADNVLDYRYSYFKWTLSSAKMRSWKAFYTQFPLISSDFLVSTEKRGKADIVKFSPTPGTALWQSRGPTLIKKILKDGAPLWENVAGAIGRDFSTTELMAMFGVRSVQKSDPENEDRFKQLLQ